MEGFNFHQDCFRISFSLPFGAPKTALGFFGIFQGIKVLRHSPLFFVVKKDLKMAPYSRLVTSRCYVSTFRNVESSLRNLNIHQFLIFSPFQQNIHLLYELLKCWDCFNEGFLIKGHLLKFTADEVALLTGLSNKGSEILWHNEPLTSVLSTEIKAEMTELSRSTDEAIIVEEFSSINWAWSIREFFINEFNKIATKFAIKKPLGYINGFLPTIEKATNLFANIKEKHKLLLRRKLIMDDPIFTFGNIVISRADIDQIITDEYLDNDHIHAFAILLSEKKKLIPHMYQPYLYISTMHRDSINVVFNIVLACFSIIFVYFLQIYKGYKNSLNMFVKHMSKISMKESNLLILPIINNVHWTLLVGILKDKVWKLYDSLSNPQHKQICLIVASFD
ncbi:hypothetical protein M5K25_018786 [Dendrobium thyrsiflorum]|uniref:Ubiquitin-like protease family profile domain-containing protein n=1 Tax=Dendrobium thyrsiflorum TaxID=117978 RepID=A0ABD0UD37_DENTH